MTTFLMGFFAGMVLYAVYLMVLSFRRAPRVIDEAEQFQRARRATTPADRRPL